MLDNNQRNLQQSFEFIKDKKNVLFSGVLIGLRRNMPLLI